VSKKERAESELEKQEHSAIDLQCSSGLVPSENSVRSAIYFLKKINLFNYYSNLSIVALS